MLKFDLTIFNILLSGIKTVFNKTGNRFVETGYLPVIRLRDVICHMAVSPGKESGLPSEMQLRNHYVDDSLHQVNHRLQCSLTKCFGCHPVQLHDCILLNSFNHWMALECGGINKASSSVWRIKMPVH